ncbi:MAG: SLATT domain-containing protein [Fusobacteriaceae bacterium]
MLEKKEFKEKVQITKNNYINMKKRISKNKCFIEFILIYYSTFLILSSITAKYFNCYNSNLDSYFNIVISVILLVISLVNANAKYSERINKIKEIIVKLQKFEEKKIDCLEKTNEEYFEIIKEAEVRTEQDFYQTAEIMKNIPELSKKTLEIFCTVENKIELKYNKIIFFIVKGLIYIYYQ